MEDDERRRCGTPPRHTRSQHNLENFFCHFLLLTLNGVAGGQRLPTSVVPSHYKLFLDPSIESQRLSGDETIDVRLTQGTKEIVLNSLGLEISAAEVDAGGNSQPAQISYEPANEMIRLAVADDLSFRTGGATP